MTPGDYARTSLKLNGGKYASSGMPSYSSVPTTGSGYSGGGDTHRGGYDMGSMGAAYSKNKSANYGKGYGKGRGATRSAGTEGRRKSGYT